MFWCNYKKIHVVSEGTKKKGWWSKVWKKEVPIRKFVVSSQVELIEKKKCKTFDSITTVILPEQQSPQINRNLYNKVIFFLPLGFIFRLEADYARYVLNGVEEFLFLVGFYFFSYIISLYFI